MTDCPSCRGTGVTRVTDPYGEEPRYTICDECHEYNQEEPVPLCADCRTDLNPLDAYRIRPPRRSPEWEANHGPYYLCVRCFKTLMGKALLQAMR
jgi:hypothetical protein